MPSRIPRKISYPSVCVQWVSMGSRHWMELQLLKSNAPPMTNLIGYLQLVRVHVAIDQAWALSNTPTHQALPWLIVRHVLDARPTVFALSQSACREITERLLSGHGVVVEWSTSGPEISHDDPLSTPQLFHQPLDALLAHRRTRNRDVTSVGHHEANLSLHRAAHRHTRHLGLE